VPNRTSWVADDGHSVGDGQPVDVSVSTTRPFVGSASSGLVPTRGSLVPYASDEVGRMDV
jgi:hypothetical protein